MNSVEAETAAEALVGDRLPSQLQWHAGACCEIAAAWLASADAARCSSPTTPPGWILERYEWGACPWPLHLCEAVEAEKLDCGALAALTRIAWGRRFPAVAPVQLVQRCEVDDAIHWTAEWSRADLRCDWISGSLIYHEAVALPAGGSLTIWDSTDGVFVDPTNRGYAAIEGICVHTPQAADFAGHRLVPGEWRWLYPDPQLP